MMMHHWDSGVLESVRMPGQSLGPLNWKRSQEMPFIPWAIVQSNLMFSLLSLGHALEEFSTVFALNHNKVRI